jgi:hypothetical protein
MTFPLTASTFRPYQSDLAAGQGAVDSGMAETQRNQLEHGLRPLSARRIEPRFSTDVGRAFEDAMLHRVEDRRQGLKKCT